MGGCCAKPSQNDQQPQDHPGERRIDQPPPQPQDNPGEGRIDQPPPQPQDNPDELRNDQPPEQPQNQPSELRNNEVKNCSFQEFSFSELQTATKNFSDEVLSANGEESVVYKGFLNENLGFVAIKRFMNQPWPNPLRFEMAAYDVGELKHKRLVKLLGYCCEEDERLLVAEFMPNDTLARRLFQQKNQTMEWSMRLRVAYQIAEALYYCSNSGFAKYDNLTVCSVLFNKDGDCCLSSFGLVREITDYERTGKVNTESVTYRFGTILVILLTGRQILPGTASKTIHGKNVTELIDPKLKGQYSTQEATKVLILASACLLCTDRETLIKKELVAELKALQKKEKVPSLEMLKQRDVASSSAQQPQVPDSAISDMGKACGGLNMEAIWDVLSHERYADPKPNTELTLRHWLPRSSKIDDLGQKADIAFRQKNYPMAITMYSKIIRKGKIVSLNVYARRCYCYIVERQLVNALGDAMKAAELFPDSSMGLLSPLCDITSI